jgi:predicted regulator of Ras-like GTPase activity (Roadblock/LC7/MglB family)
MSTEIETIIDELLNTEQNIFGVAIINKSGSLVTQTQNWDVSSDLDKINEILKAKLELGQRGIPNISLQGIKYMIVENTEERKIGTNITGKGHIIIAPVPIGGTGALICYISPQAGPRDALFTVQSFALKLQNLV